MRFPTHLLLSTLIASALDRLLLFLQTLLMISGALDRRVIPLTPLTPVRDTGARSVESPLPRSDTRTASTRGPNAILTVLSILTTSDAAATRRAAVTGGHAGGLESQALEAEMQRRVRQAIAQVDGDSMPMSVGAQCGIILLSSIKEKARGRSREAHSQRPKGESLQGIIISILRLFDTVPVGSFDWITVTSLVMYPALRTAP